MKKLFLALAVAALAMFATTGTASAASCDDDVLNATAPTEPGAATPQGINPAGGLLWVDTATGEIGSINALGDGEQTGLGTLSTSGFVDSNGNEGGAGPDLGFAKNSGTVNPLGVSSGSAEGSNPTLGWSKSSGSAGAGGASGSTAGSSSLGYIEGDGNVNVATMTVTGSVDGSLNPQPNTVSGSGELNSADSTLNPTSTPPAVPLVEDVEVLNENGVCDVD